MAWSDIWNNYINLYPGLGHIALRLGCAMLVGLVIGIEREYTHRPAGMRTHILVALGACVVSITGEMLFHYYSAMGSSADPARLSAQVITGVGFLGAGTIIREGANIKGLTTAASVWAVACLGVAAGYGYYGLALIGMIFILITLTLFEWLQHKLVNDQPATNGFQLETFDLTATLNLVNRQAAALNVTVLGLQAKTAGEIWSVSFTARFHGKTQKKRQRFLRALTDDANTKAITLSESTEYAPT